MTADRDRFALEELEGMADLVLPTCSKLNENQGSRQGGEERQSRKIQSGCVGLGTRVIMPW